MRRELEDAQAQEQQRLKDLIDQLVTTRSPATRGAELVIPNQREIEELLTRSFLSYHEEESSLDIARNDMISGITPYQGSQPGLKL